MLLFREMTFPGALISSCAETFFNILAVFIRNRPGLN